MTPHPRRRVLLVAALLASAGVRAQSPAPTGVPPELAGELPGARLLGGGTLRFFGLRVYDARLWVGGPPPGADWTASPFALELIYARSLAGEKIAERSLTEMRRQGDIPEPVAERWLGNMKQLFPDVNAGDRITGLNLPGAGARFFVNGKLRGEPREADFARMFFGIWLSPRTSEPAMREQLLGLRST